MPRSPLTEPLLRVQGMIAHVRENLSTDEYMLFLDLLVPEPEPAKKPQKKSSKKAAAGGGKSSSKSARASGMAAQLNKQLDGRRKEPEVGGFADDADMIRCTYQYPKDGPVNSGLTCNELPTDTIHDQSFGYAGYHVYQPPASSAAGAGD